MLCFGPWKRGENSIVVWKKEKLSKVQSKLIYRDFPRVRPYAGRDSTLA